MKPKTAQSETRSEKKRSGSETLSSKMKFPFAFIVFNCFGLVHCDLCGVLHFSPRRRFPSADFFEKRKFRRRVGRWRLIGREIRFIDTKHRFDCRGHCQTKLWWSMDVRITLISISTANCWSHGSMENLWMMETYLHSMPVQCRCRRLSAYEKIFLRSKRNLWLWFMKFLCCRCWWLMEKFRKNVLKRLTAEWNAFWCPTAIVANSACGAKEFKATLARIRRHGSVNQRLIGECDGAVRRWTRKVTLLLSCKEKEEKRLISKF